MSDDFENVALANKKLAENDMDGAMSHYHAILKNNKKHVKLYLTNFDLFCRNKITKKNFSFMKTIAEFYLADNFIYHQLAFPQGLKLTNFYKNFKIKKKN